VLAFLSKNITVIMLMHNTAIKMRRVMDDEDDDGCTVFV